jgi:protein arginine N-methyltransferase 1|eukprot:Transcript_26670.p2 GENE.Transcript_26670~~Transcript_26670.p2  ORF type:complete len:234 (+),score=118.48 Transcript_26670:673-1374(+)
MLDSVLFARGRHLKPGGAHWPSHAQIYMAPLHTQMHASRHAEFTEELAQWASFGEYMSASNGIDVSGLSAQYGREQFEYLMQTTQWCQVHESEVIGERFAVIDFGVDTVELEQLQVITAPFSCEVHHETELSGFGGWFDVQFNGSDGSPAPSPVTLSTAPGAQTHWAQQVFLVSPPQPVQQGDVLEGVVSVRRQKQNHRLLWVQIRFTHSRAAGPAGEAIEVQPERTLNYRIE